MSNGYSGRSRHSSIFTGTILILVGALLLLHAYHPEFQLWRPFLRWWPLLLIFWGVSKLYDRRNAQRTGDPTSGNITGGEVLLVVFILLLLGSVGAFDWFHNHRNSVDVGDIGFLRGTPYTFTDEIPVKSVPANSNILIASQRGDITVIAEDATEIRLLSKKTSYASDQQEAQSAANRMHYAITDDGNGNYNIQPAGNDAAGNGVEANLELHVPRQASIRATSGKGDVKLSGVKGNISIQSRNGDVEVRDSGADVSVNLMHGDVHVVGAVGNVKIDGSGSEVDLADIKGQAMVEGEFFGPVRASRVDKGLRMVSRRTDLTVTQLNGKMENGSGDLELSDTNGDVTLVSRRSDIKIENAGGRLQITDDGGDIQMTFAQPPRADISVETRSGDLSIALPSQSSFQMDAQTRNGDLSCDFPGLKNPGHDDEDNNALAGQVGSHGPAIRLRTQHGDISIRKSK